MYKFLISLPYLIHACMEEGSIRVLDGVVELRMRSLLAYGCRRDGLRFFVEIVQRGCGWLM